MRINESAIAQLLSSQNTDDGDYVTVPGIQVFTANPEAIAAAQNQGKLITR